MGSVFYNDNEPFIAKWLAELVKDGQLPEGDIATCSIKEVDPDAIASYTHCHFFAGIGGWPLALDMAGWPSDRRVWTMSCPCQPFSAAGKRLGTDDPRHLWPDALRLIAECRPSTIFGEQVASKDGRVWLAEVRTDLEALGYAVGAADLCAAGVGAPHIRQRLYWVAHASFKGLEGLHEAGGRERLQPTAKTIPGHDWAPAPRVLAANHGVPNFVGTLRGAGNAIVPQVTAEFIAAYLDTERQSVVEA